MKRSYSVFWAVLLLIIACLAIGAPENKTIVSAMVIILTLNIIHSAIFTPEDGFGSIPRLTLFKEYAVILAFGDSEAYDLVVSPVENEVVAGTEEEKKTSTCIVRVHRDDHEMPEPGTRFWVDKFGHLIFEKPIGQPTKMIPV